MINKKPFLILIGGGTCAGKSTLPLKASSYFPKNAFAVLSTDDFATKEIYEKAPPLPGREREFFFEYNWSFPSTLDAAFLLGKLKKLLNQEDIYITCFEPESMDNIEGKWIEKEKIIKASPIIIVEGVHALQNEELRNIADLKIYSHTDDDKRLILKIRRSPWFKKMVGDSITDLRDYGTTSENSTATALEFWWNATKPTEEKYVIPTQKWADLIVEYNESQHLSYNAKLLTSLIELYFRNTPKYQQILKDLKKDREKTIAELLEYHKILCLEKEKKRKIANSLYDLVQEQVKQKGRKVKIICDWDDCLQPVKPVAIYHYHPLSIPYEQFWKNFWETAIINPTSVGGDKLHEEYDGPEEEKIALAKFEEERQARKANPKLYAGSFYVSEERFKASLTTLAKDLLKCLKEDLIGELVIISSYRKTTTDGPEVQKFLEQERDLKKNKILRTFGQFPNCKLELTEVEKNSSGRYRPYRWEIIQQNHPDFDVYMDDSTRGILEVRDNFKNQDKIYVFPDYKCSRHIIGDNIYHIKTGISDLKDEDFTQAAQEYQQKHPELASRQAHQAEESIWKQPYLYLALGIGICLLGVGVYWLVKRNKNG